MFFKNLFSKNNLDFRFDDGGRSEAGFKGSTGDCAVRAIAIASLAPYKKIYEELYLANKIFRTTSKTKIAKSLNHPSDSPRNGTHRIVLKKYLNQLGWNWTPTMLIGQGCKVHLKKDELPDCTLIVSCSKHITVVKKGVLYDTYDCSRNGTRCVYGYWTKK